MVPFGIWKDVVAPLIGYQPTMLSSQDSSGTAFQGITTSFSPAL